MSGGTKRARRWKDRAGTEWHLRRREPARGLRGGWVMRRVGYSLVAYDDSDEAPDDERLQSWVESHAAREPGDGRTARLWTDLRNGTEWEVWVEERELVFDRGVESFRLTRDRTALPPRSMDDPELVAALDEARTAD